MDNIQHELAVVLKTLLLMHMKYKYSKTWEKLSLQNKTVTELLLLVMQKANTLCEFFKTDCIIGHNMQKLNH